MSDKSKVEAEYISLLGYKIIKGQIDTPENYQLEDNQGYDGETTVQLGTNLEKKLVKVDIRITITTQSVASVATEATGNFHIAFFFRVRNIEEFIKKDTNDDRVLIDNVLGETILSIAYSTARGILLMRLQGTDLQNFILPVINPQKLLPANQD